MPGKSFLCLLLSVALSCLLAAPLTAGGCDACQISFEGDTCPNCGAVCGAVYGPPAPTPEEPDEPDGSGPSFCEGCGQGFSTPSECGKHQATCQAYKDLTAAETGDGGEQGGYVCDGCGESFSTSDSYVEHILSCEAYEEWKAAQADEQVPEEEDPGPGVTPVPAPAGAANPAPAAPGSTGPKTAKANGGYPVEVPTNRCSKCGQRYPTKQSDADKYGVLSYYPHTARCNGEGDGVSGPPPKPGNDGGAATAPVIDFGGVPVDGAPAAGGTNNGASGGNAGGGDGGGGNLPSASGNESVAAAGADGTVQWALTVGPSTTNPENSAVAPPNCWDDWCLKYVAYAWIFGGKKDCPQISGATARISMNAFISAGLMRKVEGSIPKGAPVYWDHGQVGHIAISKGENDANGDPLIISTWVGGSQHGIFVRPLSWFNGYVGAPKGWGVVK